MYNAIEEASETLLFFRKLDCSLLHVYLAMIKIKVIPKVKYSPFTCLDKRINQESQVQLPLFLPQILLHVTLSFHHKTQVKYDKVNPIQKATTLLFYPSHITSLHTLFYLYHDIIFSSFLL